MVSRRDFLKIGAGAAALTAIGALSINDTSDQIELLTSKIKIDKLPSAFQGYRIGFLSDIHLSQALPIEWLEKAVSLLKAAKIDLLILGGDYVWLPEPGKEPLFPLTRNPDLKMPYGRELIQMAFNTVAKTIAPLKLTDGIYALWGNHDRWTSEKICKAAFDAQSIKFLKNEIKILRRGNQSILLVGFDDYWTGIPRIPKNIPENTCTICAAHNPDYFSQLLSTKSLKFDLGIAGHTHGGQIKLPLVGATYQNISDTRLSEGLFSDQSGIQIYTSKGLGMVEFPYRINCPPEVSILELSSI
ncbi:MAG: twin-arginine translocation signal domain-containing protein [Bdellovibrionota bacterium]